MKWEDIGPQLGIYGPGVFFLFAILVGYSRVSSWIDQRTETAVHAAIGPYEKRIEELERVVSEMKNGQSDARNVALEIVETTQEPETKRRAIKIAHVLS